MAGRTPRSRSSTAHLQVLAGTPRRETGLPAGIDNSVATHGGVVSYRAGAMEPLQVIDTVMASHQSLPRQDLAGLQVLLTDTRVPRNTKELVARCRDTLYMAVNCSSESGASTAACPPWSSPSWRPWTRKSCSKFSPKLRTLSGEHRRSGHPAPVQGEEVPRLQTAV